MNATDTSPRSICIEDFCGSVRFMGRHEPTSFSADFYPDTQVTCFSGAWHDVPDLHGPQPSEEAVREWARKHSAKEKEWAAEHERDLRWMARMDAISRYYAVHGPNTYVIEFTPPGGARRRLSGTCGIYDRASILDIVAAAPEKFGEIHVLTVTGRSRAEADAEIERMATCASS